MDCNEVLSLLESLGNEDAQNFKASKFGIKTSNSFGVFQKDINAIAKQIGKNDKLALELWDSENYDARILCSKIFTPKNVTSELMEAWIPAFDTWEICDSYSMKLFAHSPLAVMKINSWANREPEFEKRAAFATMAGYCIADKKAPNEVFEDFLLLIKRESWDERLYVKKAVNWALRGIGKRNEDLKSMAINAALDIAKIDLKGAKWIGNNALKELLDPKVRSSDYPRNIYRRGTSSS